MPGDTSWPSRPSTPICSSAARPSDAIAFYEKALEAKVVQVARFSDTPGSDVPAEHANTVMHAHLETGGGTLLLSDGKPGRRTSRETASSSACSTTAAPTWTGTSPLCPRAARVAEPLQDTFWGARFGLLIDRFGIHWMFNATLTE